MDATSPFEPESLSITDPRRPSSACFVCSSSAILMRSASFSEIGSTGAAVAGATTAVTDRTRGSIGTGVPTNHRLKRTAGGNSIPRLSQFDSSRNWYLIYCVQGVRIRRTWHFRCEAIASQLAHTLEGVDALVDCGWTQPPELKNASNSTAKRLFQGARKEAREASSVEASSVVKTRRRRC